MIAVLQSLDISIEDVLTFSQTTNFRHSQTESDCRRCRQQFSNLMKMAEDSSNSQKTLWEKEKLLVVTNFFFSYSVFKQLLLQTRKNQGSCEKGLPTSRKKPTDYIVEKREFDGNQHFLLFPQCFLCFQRKQYSTFSQMTYFRLLQAERVADSYFII